MAKKKSKTKSRVTLKIANVVIEIMSEKAMTPLNKKYDWRYKNFLYKTQKAADIKLKVKVAASRTIRRGAFAKNIFTTIHPLSKEVNWRLFKKGEKYFMEQYTGGKKQRATLNKNFSRGIIYLYNQKKPSWELSDIIYDLLQIILINYFTENDGIFVHSVAIKDIDENGFLFPGESGRGKSTMARLWDRYSRAQILNDDRVVVRKIKNNFFIFGTPWHGDFSDYLRSLPEKALLKKIFFIHHYGENKLKSLAPKESFKRLYPNIFLTFWDRDALEKQIKLSKQIAEKIECFNFGFVNDKSAVSFVRKTK